ncbi:uncharacterized protein ARMOST_19472 [Armillaria ostoyae]|uniref:Uncharacterized protein n=1 Tax=Armillaria ostoyae TaxID=47428 RepID=A0A284S4N3_ARMOS|nr:uncharacterized protein ARMOST_19472 [Armillaria ostoyae]
MFVDATGSQSTITSPASNAILLPNMRMNTSLRRWVGGLYSIKVVRFTTFDINNITVLQYSATSSRFEPPGLHRVTPSKSIASSIFQFAPNKGHVTVAVSYVSWVGPTYRAIDSSNPDSPPAKFFHRE